MSLNNVDITSIVYMSIFIASIISFILFGVIYTSTYFMIDTIFYAKEALYSQSINTLYKYIMIAYTFLMVVAINIGITNQFTMYMTSSLNNYFKNDEQSSTNTTVTPGSILSRLPSSDKEFGALDLRVQIAYISMIVFVISFIVSLSLMVCFNDSEYIKIVMYISLLLFLFTTNRICINLYLSIITSLTILSEIDYSTSLPIDTDGQDKDIIYSLEWWYSYGGIKYEETNVKLWLTDQIIFTKNLKDSGGIYFNKNQTDFFNVYIRPKYYDPPPSTINLYVNGSNVPLVTNDIRNENTILGRLYTLYDICYTRHDYIQTLKGKFTDSTGNPLFDDKSSIWSQILENDVKEGELSKIISNSQNPIEFTNYSIYDFQQDLNGRFITHHFVMPRHFCESILFKPGEDLLFDVKYNKKLLSGYPNPVKHTKAWRKLILFWLQGSTLSYQRSDDNDDNEQRFWYWHRNPDSGYYKLAFKPTSQEPLLDEWNNTVLHPDNIFCRYNIDPRSNLIETLVNSNMSNDLYQYRDACVTLLGFNMNGGKAHNLTSTINRIPSVGGWLGFFRAWNKLPRDITPEQFIYGIPSITDVQKNMIRIQNDLDMIQTMRDTRNTIYQNVPSLSCPSGPFRTSPFLSNLPPPPPREKVIDIMSASYASILKNVDLTTEKVKLPPPDTTQLRNANDLLRAVRNDPPDESRFFEAAQPSRTQNSMISDSVSSGVGMASMAVFAPEAAPLILGAALATSIYQYYAADDEEQERKDADEAERESGLTASREKYAAQLSNAANAVRTAKQDYNTALTKVNDLEKDLTVQKTNEKIKEYNDALSRLNNLNENNRQIRELNEKIYDDYLKNRENALSMIEKLPVRPEGCP
jgi:hypothetical protein